jgi:hypothetical protein
MMIELSTTKVFMKLGEFAVANGTIREGIEKGMMKGGTSTSVPVIQPCSFRALQQDEQPDHLLILVHGILARSVPSKLLMKSQRSVVIRVVRILES